MSREQARPALGKAEAAALIAAAPALAGLTVTEAQLPGVTTYLTIGLRIASSIGASSIGASSIGASSIGGAPAENAPVFEA